MDYTRAGSLITNQLWLTWMLFEDKSHPVEDIFAASKNLARISNLVVFRLTVFY